MIKLDVKDYCQNCEEFEPVKSCAMVAESLAGERAVETVVKCKYAKRCERIAGRMEKAVTEEPEVEADVEFDFGLLKSMFEESEKAFKKLMKSITK